MNFTYKEFASAYFNVFISSNDYYLNKKIECSNDEEEEKRIYFYNPPKKIGPEKLIAPNNNIKQPSNESDIFKKPYDIIKAKLKYIIDLSPKKKFIGHNKKKN